MARIVLSFYNAIVDEDNIYAMPCFYESLIKELTEVGNDILVLAHKKPGNDWGDIPENILQTIKQWQPDVFFLFNNDFYDITKEFSCPIIIYEVDSPLLYSNIEVLKQNNSRYKFIVPQVTSVDILERNYGVSRKNILYAPFFTAIKAEKLEQNINISFIGSNFTWSPVSTIVNEFMKIKPSKEDIANFKLVMKYFEQKPFSTNEEILRDLWVSTTNISKFIDVSAMLWMISDNRRVQVLSQIADLGLELYGTANWAADVLYEPELTLSFNAKKIYSLEHNQTVYNSSKLCINVNHLQAKSGFSWRVADIMASNGCLVSEYRPDFARLFPCTNIPLFHNRYEAREICVKLLQDHELRQDIVQQCQNAVQQVCSFKKVWSQVEEFTGITMLSNNFKNGKCNFITSEMITLKSEEVIEPKQSKIISIKYKLYYKVWEIVSKKLRKKGFLS